MDQNKGKACWLTNRTSNPIMNRFELAMGDRDRGE